MEGKVKLRRYLLSTEKKHTQNRYTLFIEKKTLILDCSILHACRVQLLYSLQAFDSVALELLVRDLAP